MKTNMDGQGKQDIFLVVSPRATCRRSKIPARRQNPHASRVCFPSPSGRGLGRGRMRSTIFGARWNSPLPFCRFLKLETKNLKLPAHPHSAFGHLLPREKECPHSIRVASRPFAVRKKIKPGLQPSDLSTSGSRMSIQRPSVFAPAMGSLASIIVSTASVNSYSPRGDFCSLAVCSNTTGRKM